MTEAHHIDILRVEADFEVVNEIILRIHHGKKLLLSGNIKVGNHSQHRVFSCTYYLIPGGGKSWSSYSGSWCTGISSMGKSSMSITSMGKNGTGVDSWGYSVFMCVHDTGWTSNTLDDWFTLDWGWDVNVVWGINMDWGWYFDGVGYVLEDFIWDIVWFLNWDWLVDNKGFLADTSDWGIVRNSSQKNSWDGNVDVSKDWFKNGGVVSSNVWPGSVFDLLGDDWLRYMNRDGIWSSDMLGAVWGWDADGSWGRGGNGNWSSSIGTSIGWGSDSSTGKSWGAYKTTSISKSSMTKTTSISKSGITVTSSWEGSVPGFTFWNWGSQC
jgi:hypothetical protein